MNFPISIQFELSDGTVMRISGDASPGSLPSGTSGPPENYDPGEGPEADIQAVTTPDGTSLTYDEFLEVLRELNGRDERKVDDTIDRICDLMIGAIPPEPDGFYDFEGPEDFE